MLESCPITNGVVFKCHLITGLDLVWYSDHHLNTGHLNNDKVKVCFSDVSVIQMFTIQITTVFGIRVPTNFFLRSKAQRWVKEDNDC